MKFIKANLVLVICGAVVLLALVSIWYPTLSWEGDLAARLGGYHQEQASAIDTQTRQPLVLPGVPARSATATATAPAAPEFLKVYGVPTDNLITIKKNDNADMTREAEKVIQIGAEANRTGRVNGQGVPLLDGVPQQGYLPKLTGVDPERFKNQYNALFDKWMVTLVGPQKGTSYPPLIEELTAAFQAKATAAAAALPAGLRPDASGQPSTKELNDYIRKQVMTRAGFIYMYVDQGPPTEGTPAGMVNAFQKRPWASDAAPPNETDIFQALVDCWFQGDVVKAIAAVNEDVLKNVDSAKKNVASSPIKRLMKISVGNPEANTPRLGTAAQGIAGGMGGAGAAPAGGGASTVQISSGLWYMAGPAAPAAAPTGDAPAPPPPGAGVPNTIDFSRTLTGRASGNDYDVVQMQIWMDIDPAYLNKFIEALYKQNMGYTVLSIKFKTVDPLDRASNGFIYGETQVIEVEMLVEGLLFRDWSQKLMPKEVATYLQVPAPPPPPGAGG